MPLSRNKKVVFLTNIVAPYRVFLFNKLEEIRASSSFDFEVYFMRMTEADRNWDVKLSDLKFKYIVGNGFYLMIKGFHLHFNPVLIFKLIRSKHEIVLGSSWNDLNVLTIALLKSFGLIKNKLSVWSEANYLTISSQKRSKIRDRLRKWFFLQIDGNFIVPGQMSIKSFEKWEIPVSKVVILPNLVSSQIFKSNSLYKENLGEKPIFVMVARLEENIKGIMNFFVSVGNENLKKVIIRIAGTGSCFDDYIKYIQLNKLEQNIFLLGELSQEEVRLEYENADVFVLPSYTDASPLVLVEAIFSGLPILVSERCGNHFEAVINGQNGYTFDPLNQTDIKNKFDLILSGRNKWKDFSKSSLQIAKSNFDSDSILASFIKSF